MPKHCLIGVALHAVSYTHLDVYKRQGMAVQKAITAGNTVGDRIEVIDGLQKGDSLVVAGLINISDGAPVKSIQESLNE